jgi:hypothetical protein
MAREKEKEKEAAALRQQKRDFETHRFTLNNLVSSQLGTSLD